MASARGEGSRVQSLLDWRDELSRQAAGSQFRLDNLARTIDEDEKLLASHRQMREDNIVDLAVSKALIQAIDDELEELAPEKGEESDG